MATTAVPVTHPENTFPNLKCWTIGEEDSYKRVETKAHDVLATDTHTLVLSIPSPFTRGCTNNSLAKVIQKLPVLEGRAKVVVHSTFNAQIIASWIVDQFNKINKIDLSEKPISDWPITFIADPHHEISDALNITTFIEGVGDHVCRRAAYIVDSQMNIVWNPVEKEVGDYEETTVEKAIARLDELEDTSESEYKSASSSSGKAEESDDEGGSSEASSSGKSEESGSKAESRASSHSGKAEESDDEDKSGSEGDIDPAAA